MTSLAWNTYLSYASNRAVAKPAAAAAAPAGKGKAAPAKGKK